MDQKWFEELSRLQRELMEHLASGLESLVGPGMVGRLGAAGQVPRDASYRILGLSPAASDEEVRRRYRELAKRLHPDVAGPETGHLFQLVQAAYEQVSRERGWR